MAGGNLEFGGKPVNNPIHHACRCAVDDDRPGDGEHFGTHAGDKALCLCQVRTKFFAVFSTVEKLIDEN